MEVSRTLLNNTKGTNIFITCLSKGMAENVVAPAPWGKSKSVSPASEGKYEPHLDAFGSI